MQRQLLELVNIKTKNQMFSGRVISKHNYGTRERPNWYIQIGNHNMDYFKQDKDGPAEITFVPEVRRARWQHLFGR